MPVFNKQLGFVRPLQKLQDLIQAIMMFLGLHKVKHRTAGDGFVVIFWQLSWFVSRKFIFLNWRITVTIWFVP